MSQQDSSVQLVKEKRNQLNKLLNSETIKGQISMALPKHINPDVMIRVALTAISKQPKLLECDQASLIGAIITSSQLGLMPDGVLGEAYLIPFGKSVNFIPGYKGLAQLAFRSGKVKELYTEPVYAGDEFRYTKGLHRDLVHVPDSDGVNKTKERPTHFYAVIKYISGGFDFEVMTQADVNLVRARSQGKNNKVWDDYFEEMGKKTVLRKLLKMAPLSTELQKAVGLDEEHFVLNKSQMNSQNTTDFADEVGFDPFTEVVEESQRQDRENTNNNAEKQKQKSEAATQAAIDAMNNAKK
jgi:recombination protein RecT